MSGRPGGPAPRGAPGATTPGWVAAASGGPVVDARQVRWGFSHETWVVNTLDGRALVLQHRVDGSDPTHPRFRAVRRAVRAAGLPVPEPVRVEVEGRDVVVALPFVEGVVAAELLGSDGGPELVGRLCGEVATRLATVPAADLRVSRTWASAGDLWAAAMGWVESLPDIVPAATRERLLVAVDDVVVDVQTAPPRFAHGDLAPVNVLVRDGRVAAVLDLDRARLAHPLFDAAWFAWVVWLHHRDVAGAARSAYARAVGAGDRSPAALAWLWPLQLLERLSEARDEDERTRWAGRLATTIENPPGSERRPS